ncbi:FAD dependent oxidoreductase [Pyrenochaeta sp. MPI-SDFR-AT-0127]|nr:FAD dependent oxidoreductase [Pyrenochaeta sp. MPI-SDFR-AT-0127]
MANSSHFSRSLPRGGPVPFWRTSVGELDNHRSTEVLPTESDIVIIGAGFSAAAYVTHLLSQKVGELPSTLVLEARELCSGATGRNGGHLKPDYYNLASSLIDRYGIEAAAEVADFEAANVTAVSDFVQENQIDCDFNSTFAVDVQLTDALDHRMKAGYDRMMSAGVESTKKVSYFAGGDAEMICDVKGAKSIFYYPAGHLWPYKLIHHMFAKAIAQGVNLQTNTPVTAISDEVNSLGRTTVHTERGDVKAKKVIVMTNAYTSRLLPEYKDKIIPYRAICSRIVPSGPAVRIRNTYALRFGDFDFDYLIPRTDGSIIVGGARRAFFHDLQQWYGRVDDDTLIDDAKEYFDGYMQRNFKGWENSGAYVDKVWTGIMGYSSDRLPRIGKVPGRPGVFIMGGFTGHGMPQIFLAAKGLAKMVLDDTPYEELGLPRVFQESDARLKDKENAVLDGYNKSLRAKI